MNLDHRRTASGVLAAAVASALVLTGSAAGATSLAAATTPTLPGSQSSLATAVPGSEGTPRLEDLDRGLVAARTDGGVFLSWRLLAQEVTGSSEAGLTGSDFVVYRDGVALAAVTDSTSYLDPAGAAGSVYSVAALVDGVEQQPSDEVTPWADTFTDVPLDRPADGVTPAGEAYTYAANDMSVGDVDGDGTYELVVKWDPSNAKDVSQRGYTGPVFIDTYRTDGTLLHRVDLGVNIRAGAHYTQFLVYDLDGDGRAEMMLKTAPGTRTTTYDSTGAVTAESYVTMPQADVDAGYTHDDDYRMSAADYREHLVDVFQGWSEHPEVVAGAWPATLQEALALDGVEPLPAMDYPLSRQDAEVVADHLIDDFAPARSSRNVLRDFEGFVLDGPEYLTVFDGATGAELETVPYAPGRTDDGLLWGDYAMSRIEPGNRVDRFLATVAYLDGERPSAVLARGYYTRTTLVAYDWDGEHLTQRWDVDSGWTPMSNPFDDSPHGVEGTDPEFGTLTTQGFHSLSSADVDGDGRQEIVYGSATIDDDGQSLLYSSYDVLPPGSADPGALAKLGHGDAMHVTDIDPDRPGLEIFTVHEGGAYAPYGYALRDASTGEVLFGEYSGVDTGRGMIGDVEPGTRGVEVWAGSPVGETLGLQAADGTALGDAAPGTNMSILWQPDLTRQVVEGSGTQTPVVRDWATGEAVLTATGTLTNNGTKGTPSLVADILGDWREELLVRTADSSAIRIYTSATVSQTKMYTLMHDPQYRAEVARQQTTYNQPSYVGFYLASGMTAQDWSRVPVPTVVTEPSLVVDATATSAVSGEAVALDVRLGSGYPAVPTGQVELVVDGAVSGAPLDLVDGAVRVDVPVLAVGDHSLTVRYLGDQRYTAVESGTLPLAITRGAVDVVLTTAGGPAVSTAQDDQARALAQAVEPGTVSVSVVPQAPATGVPTGTVEATVDGVPSGLVVELADGTAVLSLADLPAGERTLLVGYSGDSAFEGAQSAPVIVTVAQDGTVLPVPTDPAPGTDPVPGADPAPTEPPQTGSGAGQQSSGLAVTGTEVASLGVAALLLAAAGWLALRAARRRREV